MKMHWRFAMVVLVLTAFSAAAHAQKATIHGQVLDSKGQPLKGAEIRIQAYDQSVGGFGLRTDSDGNFTIKVPPATYKVTIRVADEDVFAANNMRVRANDPLSITYNMKRALVTMSSEHSKKIRRFAYQSERTGSQISGRWVETTAPEGYEPEAQHVETKSSNSVLREMQKGHPGNVPGGF
jgi:Carboxypeptidase regulatory-like domain